MPGECDTCRHLHTWCDEEPCRSCWDLDDGRRSAWEPATAPLPASGCPADGPGPTFVGFPDAPPEIAARVADPYHEAKHDLGKLRWDCLPWPAVEQVVRVLTFGAKKYSAWSWPGVPDARRRYFAAAIRHAVAWLRGEKLDPESGLPHLAHLACNALFLLSFDLDEAKPPAALEGPKPPAGEP